MIRVATICAPADVPHLERMKESLADLADEFEVMETTLPDGFGAALGEVITKAAKGADWVLRMDADMTAEVFPTLKAWLAEDTCPETNVWMVDVVEDWGRYRLPLLVRGGREWSYTGVTHEYLDYDHDKARNLLGLCITHHCDGNTRAEKFERDLQLLAPGYEERDARSVFYYAQSLKGLGRTEEAIKAYKLRVKLGGWEEERWYAAFQAALLAEDVEALLRQYKRRPHRHEPLTAAARIVGKRGAADDRLFLDTPLGG